MSIESVVVFFTFERQGVTFIRRFYQNSRGNNLFGGLLNEIVAVASSQEANDNDDSNENDEFLFGSDAELARIVGISVFHGNFPFFLWVLPDFSVYLRCLKPYKARSLTLHISKQNKYK